MRIIVNCFIQFFLEVELSDKIEYVKNKIEAKNGIRVDHQVLQFNGNVLNDSSSLISLGLTENARIDLIPIYPDIDESNAVDEKLQHFIKFHSNCQSWMTQSLINAGNMVKENNKFKMFCEKLIEKNEDLKKRVERLEKGMEEHLKECELKLAAIKNNVESKISEIVEDKFRQLNLE